MCDWKRLLPEGRDTTNLNRPCNGAHALTENILKWTSSCRYKTTLSNSAKKYTQDKDYINNYIQFCFCCMTYLSEFFKIIYIYILYHPHGDWGMVCAGQMRQTFTGDWSTSKLLLFRRAICGWGGAIFLQHWRRENKTKKHQEYIK